MLCVLPVSNNDLHQLRDLLIWMEQLGGCKSHEALIVADAALGYDGALECKKIASRIFAKTGLICTPRPVTGWPQGANALFYRAAQYVQQWRKSSPWLWMEADSIPLKPNWLDTLESAYKSSDKPFFGHIYDCEVPPTIGKYMSAIAVYPGDAFNQMSLSLASNEAFDVMNSGVMVLRGNHTNLIHHFWGTPGQPPTFREKAVPNTNIFSLASIHPDALIFHRNKDGSLFKLLRKNMGIEVSEHDAPSRKVFIQMGRYGDLIILLPAMLRHYHETGQKPVLICAHEFASVLKGVSYLETVPLAYHWWKGMPQARNYAKTNYGGAVVTQCYAHEWGINLSEWPDFMSSMLDRAGLPVNEIAIAPIIFDARDSKREADLIKKHRRTTKPLLLVNFSGHSSPFHHALDVMRLVNKYASKFEILDLGRIRANRLYDLLGLYDVAAGAIHTDTSTYHLAHASKCPYAAFLMNGWTGSIARSSCSLAIRYDQTLQRLHELEPLLQQWN
jgi:hypothetical protein